MRVLYRECSSKVDLVRWPCHRSMFNSGIFSCVWKCHPPTVAFVRANPLARASRTRECERKFLDTRALLVGPTDFQDAVAIPMGGGGYAFISLARTWMFTKTRSFLYVYSELLLFTALKLCIHILLIFAILSIDFWFALVIFKESHPKRFVFLARYTSIELVYKNKKLSVLRENKTKNNILIIVRNNLFIYLLCIDASILFVDYLTTNTLKLLLIFFPPKST